MTIDVSFYTSPLQPTYSGDPAIRRQTGIDAAGAVVQIDLIQSLPKGGRWRHVVRGVYTDVPDAVTKIASSTTVTVTFDHPATGQAPEKTQNIIQGFLGAFADRWDEVALGQH